MNDAGRGGPLLHSAPAFRDLGGIAVAGGLIRRGRLFRSEALLNLTAKEKSTVAALGVKTVCDLRSQIERDANPCMDWLAPPPRRMSFDLTAQLSAGTAPALERMRAEPGPAAALHIMLSTYECLPQAGAAALRTLLAALAAGETPVVIHCTAGKDRTGFVIAMLLAALGVSREGIYEDYMRLEINGASAHAARTAQMMSLFLQRPLDPESLAVLSSVRRAYLDTAFAALERQWGNTDNYLSEAVGLDAATRQRVLESLIESRANNENQLD
jgi:protein-tyrosine phosphatase